MDSKSCSASIGRIVKTEGGEMNEYYSYCPGCGESLTYSYCRCIRENPKTVDVTENWGKLMADLDSTREELELNKKLLARQCDLAREAETEKARWKTMAQRHNPSGCCCQIDENNGDPKMVEPCAFHAEWRDVKLKRCKKSLLCEEVEHNATMKELEELQKKWNEEQSNHTFGILFFSNDK